MLEVDLPLLDKHIKGNNSSFSLKPQTGEINHFIKIEKLLTV